MEKELNPKVVLKWWKQIPIIDKCELTWLVIDFKKSYKYLRYSQILEIYNYIKN